MDANAKTARWLEYRRGEWTRASERLDAIEHGKRPTAQTVLEVVRAYPEIAKDLAIARRSAPKGPVARHLEHLYLRMHRLIFRPPTRFVADLRKLFVRDAAQVARTLTASIAWIVCLFFASAAAGAWLVTTYPELISLFASEEMIDRVSRGELWTDNLLNALPSSLLATQIFTNNIVVCLTALCLGVFYGLGTLYIIGMNGLMLGALFAFTSAHGLGGRLFEFVVAHGFVELSVIFVSGAAGVTLGEALVRPGQLSRAAAFHAATMRAAQLMGVLLAFLIGAGLIEGYVSPNPSFALPLRLTIGLAYFGLFIAVLGGFFDRAQIRRWARSSA
jgi:uncharacterized membrane protein SpoIIM required for sporulation